MQALLGKCDKKPWILLQLHVNKDIYVYLQVIFNRQQKVEICCRNIFYRNIFLEEKCVEIHSRNLADIQTSLNSIAVSILGQFVKDFSGL